MSRPRVFVINETLRPDGRGNLKPIYDILPAREYGDLVHLLPAGQLPHNIDAVTQAVNKGLADITPQDSLLLIGSPVAIAIASAVAADMLEGQLCVLRWINKERRYERMVARLWYAEPNSKEDRLVSTARRV